MIVYWCDEDAFRPHGIVVDTYTRANQVMQELKDRGKTHIVLVEDPLIQVGAADAGGIVQDGKLPDGSDYTWKKRRP